MITKIDLSSPEGKHQFLADLALVALEHPVCHKPLFYETILAQAESLKIERMFYLRVEHEGRIGVIPFMQSSFYEDWEFWDYLGSHYYSLYVPPCPADLFRMAFGHFPPTKDPYISSAYLKQAGIEALSASHRSAHWTLPPTFDDYLRLLNAKHRQNLNAVLRKNADLTVRFSNQLDENIDELVKEYCEYWNERSDDCLYDNARKTLVDIALFKLLPDTALIQYVYFQGKLVACNFSWVHDGDVVDMLALRNMGDDMKARRLGLFAIVQNIKHAIEKGYKSYSLTSTDIAGTECPYKDQFIPPSLELPLVHLRTGNQVDLNFGLTDFWFRGELVTDPQAALTYEGAEAEWYAVRKAVPIDVQTYRWFMTDPEVKDAVHIDMCDKPWAIDLPQWRKSYVEALIEMCEHYDCPVPSTAYFELDTTIGKFPMSQEYDGLALHPLLMGLKLTVEQATALHTAWIAHNPLMLEGSSVFYLDGEPSECSAIQAIDVPVVDLTVDNLIASLSSKRRYDLRRSLQNEMTIRTVDMFNPNTVAEFVDHIKERFGDGGEAAVQTISGILLASMHPDKYKGFELLNEDGEVQAIAIIQVLDQHTAVGYSHAFVPDAEGLGATLCYRLAKWFKMAGYVTYDPGNGLYVDNILSRASQYKKVVCNSTIKQYVFTFDK